MRTHRLLLALALVVATAGAVYARKHNDDKGKGNWIQSSFDKWSVKDVRTILENSPWSETKDIRGQVTGEHGNFNPGSSGVGGNATLGTDVTNYEFTATLFSSLPVREAYVRMFQIENHYDTLPAAKQQAFNQNPTVDALLHGDVSQEVMVNLSYHVNDPIAERNLNQWFNTQTTDTLKNNAYLYTPAGQIILKKYIPPSQSHGFGARFIFPRQFNGEPILSSPSGKLRFQLSWIQGPNQSFYIDFKPEKMVYEGKLSF